MLFKKYHFSIFFISLLLILFFTYLFDNHDYELKYSFAIQDVILPNKTISYFIKQGDYNFQTIRDFHTAIKWYEKALAIDKNNVEALSKKGEALSTLYNYSEAVELVDKALDLNQIVLFLYMQKAIHYIIKVTSQKQLSTMMRP